MGAGGVYSLDPKEVPQVETAYRKIHTKFPVPEAIPILEELRGAEPRSMEGQPPVVWDRAEGFQVYDAWGNKGLDFSSGVLVTNAGHGRKEIIDAVVAQAQHGLLHNYCFPNSVRGKLAARLVELAPESMTRAFLLSTGSEATECAVKLSRTWGQKVGGPTKNVMVSFDYGFHGRTLGAQLIGGIPALKTWIGQTDPRFVQAPYPDGYRTTDVRFDLFEESLAKAAVSPDQVCGVITETFQGGTAAFMPVEYARQLRQWCDAHNVVMICDEVQAAFGRAGTFWGFEHYGIVPDLMCLGKGISSSLPISAVVGREDLVNLYPPGSMTSTHSGNPICCAAALASIDLIVKEDLAGNAARVGEVLRDRLDALRQRYPERIGCINSHGLVAAIQCVKSRRWPSPDAEIAGEIITRCIESGLLMFAPVGLAGSSIKIAPPLCITAEAVEEGVAVLADCFEAVLGKGA